MDEKAHTPLVRVTQIVGEQWRSATVAQMRAAGWSRTMLSGAVARGVLSHPHQGVYTLGPPPSMPYERAMAAVLAVGPAALLSHAWCRWLFGVGGLPRHDPDVSAATRSGRRAGVTVHRTRISPEPDANHGIPCTRPERMILDCAPDLTPKQLRRLVNDVQIKRLASIERIRGAIAAHPGRATAALKAQVPLDQHGATRSLLEDLLVDLARDHGLPRPAINAIVEGYEVDFSYPGLVIEADGYRFHGTKIAFEDDREKWLALEARGQRVVPVSYRQVTELRERTAGQLLAVLRSPAGRPCR
jgi:very-short-patch-repair endonuclease